MKETRKHNTGYRLLFGAAAFTGAGGFLFDYNKTHLFNPRWTPHAKFHDAMTILLGSMLGGAGLYLLQKKSGDQKTQLKWGTMLPAFFWTAQAGSFAFPGAKGLESEFSDKVPQLGPLRLNEAPMSIFMLSVLALGYTLAKKKAKF
ncbi:hypothetical protein HUW51_05045 [Adhaeribacter swui]|uniref:Acetyltransferase n=1 Tax=Adhaeribacter swui TaxID=2086471 RepID=A0A7G7G4P2_9BACT|nr:DUF6640 family protein [Adhaeribacter swui]QNF32126.1 hypothetical protein HUW51_05045 [Adhaeribacter swui]